MATYTAIISSNKLQTVVTQAAHGFVVGDFVRYSNMYVYAQADTAANAEMLGMVVNVASTSVFTIQQTGRVTGIAPTWGPFVAGRQYFLSTANPGKATLVNPTAVGVVSKPVFTATSTTDGFIRDLRGMINVESGSDPVPPDDIFDLVNTTLTAATPYVAAGWLDIGLCGIITTTTADQEVLIMLKLSLAGDGSNGVAYRIVRNTVPIDIGAIDATAPLATRATGGMHSTVAAIDSGMSINETFLDAPALAGVYTYCVEVNKGNCAGVTVNAGFTDANAANYFRTTSSLILLGIRD